MKTVKYTFLVEGIIEECFIPLMLEKIGKENDIIFIKNNGSLKANAEGKDKVLNKADRYAKMASLQKSDLFIVGVDLEIFDHSGDLYIEEKENLTNTIKKSLIEVFPIVFVAVQAFDYWLLYENQKYTANSLEAKTKDDVKKWFYGDKGKARDNCEKIAKKIIQSIDFAIIAKKSKSFKNFYYEILSFIKEK
ncbi:MAG: hypothetical protein MUC49_18040 [Raineya sp.]|jgi:hypothetical protein|nr:hypothetical protein [Raineya sp.]